MQHLFCDRRLRILYLKLKAYNPTISRDTKRMCDQNEMPLEVELQSLEAIYVNELTFTRKDDGSVDKIEVLIHPATGHDATKQFVCMTLVFEPGPNYPDEVPDIEIRNPRGLGDEEVASLVEALISKGEEVKGEVMMYTLIEMAKDSLTDGNIPRCPCVVCLEHFHQQDSFHRTACYHYFHTACLYKYVQHTRAQLEEEKKEALERRHVDTANSETRMIVCPLCRRGLDESLLSVTWTEDISQEDSEFHFVMPPEMRERQRKMAEIYERQKAKGGIIDPELEKNKFLVNYEDRFFVYTANETVETQSVREQRADKDSRKKKGRNKPGGRQQHSHQKGSAIKHSSHMTLDAKGFHRSTRSNVHGTRPQANRRFEKHPHRSETVPGSDLVKQDGERVLEARANTDAGVCDSESESSGDLAKDPEFLSGSATTSALESIGRLNIECPGEAVSVQHQSPSESSVTSDAETRGTEIKFKKWDSEDAFSNRHNERASNEKSGHLGSPRGGSESWHKGKSGSHHGSKQSSHGARGHSRKADGRYYDHHHSQYPSQHPHQDHWRQHERHREPGERRQQGPGDIVGKSTGGEHASSSGEKSLDPESQEDVERKNFHINGKWRPLYFTPDGLETDDSNCDSVCRKMLSSYINLSHDRFGLLENKENICSNTPVDQEYDVNECYVGFGSMDAEDEWEAEVDPYAFERSCIRRKKLESYDKMKTADAKVYEKRLENRVSTEVMIIEEERRMEKERAKQEDDLDECKTSGGINDNYVMDKQMKVCGKEFNFISNYKMLKSQGSNKVSYDLDRKLDVTDRESVSDLNSISKGSDMKRSVYVKVDSKNIGQLCQFSLNNDKLCEPHLLSKLDTTQLKPLAPRPAVDECSSLAPSSAMSDTTRLKPLAPRTAVDECFSLALSSAMSDTTRLKRLAPRTAVDECSSLAPSSAMNARVAEVQVASVDSKRKHLKKAPPLVLPKRAKQSQAGVVSSISAKGQATDFNSAWRQNNDDEISSISAKSQETDVNSAWRQSHNSDASSMISKHQASDVTSAWRQSHNSNFSSICAKAQAHTESQATNVNSADKPSQTIYTPSVSQTNVMSSAVPPAKHKFVKVPPLNLSRKSKNPVVKETPRELQDIIREMNVEPTNPPADIQDIIREMNMKAPNPPTDIQGIIREINMKTPKPSSKALPGNSGPDSNHNSSSSLQPRDPLSHHPFDLFSQGLLPQPLGAGYPALASQDSNNEAFINAYYKALGLIPDLFISSRNPLTEDLSSGQSIKRNK